MQILLVADLHYALPQFDWVMSVAEDFEAVVIAGDLLESASHVALDTQITVVRTYLEELGALSRLFVCSGNHDLTASCETSGEKTADWLSPGPSAAFFGDGTAEKVNRALISVLPWWDGPASRDAVTAQLTRDRTAEKNKWLWVYHAPPADCPVSWAGARFFGDPALSDWIHDFRPDIVLCGHVHEAPFVQDGTWVHRLGSAWVFNAGQQPGPTPAHIILDLERQTALWFSIYGNETITLTRKDARPASLNALPDWFKASGPAPT